jgi:hypothetical protein
MPTLFLGREVLSRQRQLRLAGTRFELKGHIRSRVPSSGRSEAWTVSVYFAGWSSLDIEANKDEIVSD